LYVLGGASGAAPTGSVESIDWTKKVVWKGGPNMLQARCDAACAAMNGIIMRVWTAFF